MDTPRLDAELLLAHAIGVDRTAVVAHGEAPVGRRRPRRTFRAYLDRRAGRRAGRLHPRPQGVLRDRPGRGRPGAHPAAGDRALVDLAVGEVDGPARRAAARGAPGGAGDRRRHGQRRGRRSPWPSRSGSAASRPRTWRSPRPMSPRTRSTSRARTPSVTPSGTGSSFVSADLLPPDSTAVPWDVVLANLPYIRTDELAAPAAWTWASSRSSRSTAGATGWRSSAGCSRRSETGLAPDGVAFLEIGADQGESIAAPRRGAPAGLVVPGRGGPGRAAADRRRASGVGRVSARPPGADTGESMALPDRVCAVSPEPAFPIRLIALDIDGTIIGDDHTIGPRARSRPCGRRWSATSRSR